MIHILGALLGRRTCLWCQPEVRTDTLYDRLIIDHRPNWLIFLRWDSLVGRVIGAWHNRHHTDRHYEGTCRRCDAYAWQRDSDGQPICDWCAEEQEGAT
jgi:hypothetical protein